MQFLRSIPYAACSYVPGFPGSPGCAEGGEAGLQARFSVCSGRWKSK